MCVYLKPSLAEQEVVPAASKARISILCFVQSEKVCLYTPRLFPTCAPQFLKNFFYGLVLRNNGVHALFIV